MQPGREKFEILKLYVCYTQAKLAKRVANPESIPREYLKTYILLGNHKYKVNTVNCNKSKCNEPKCNKHQFNEPNVMSPMQYA